MSKQPIKDKEGLKEDLPPPYTRDTQDTQGTQDTPAPPRHTLPPPYTQRADENHLVAFPTLEEILTSPSFIGDISHILAILQDPIDDFVTRASRLKPAPRMVEGTFIPEESLTSGWTLVVDEGEDHKSAQMDIIRVKTKSEDAKLSKEKASQDPEESSSSKKEFDEWGRWDEPGSSTSAEDALWWSDRHIAARVARTFQRKTMNGMDFKAEHVTFRRENEMGIWESRSGWGILLRLRLHQV